MTVIPPPIIGRMIANARDLRSNTGENAEYDRALVELITSMMPGDPEVIREYIEYAVLT